MNDLSRDQFVSEFLWYLQWKKESFILKLTCVLTSYIEELWSFFNCLVRVSVPFSPSCKAVFPTLLLKKNYMVSAYFFPNLLFLIHLVELLENPVSHRIAFFCLNGQKVNQQGHFHAFCIVCSKLSTYRFNASWITINSSVKLEIGLHP